MLEEILNRRNVEKALEQVEGNKGAGGIDGMKWHELRTLITVHWQEFRQSILNATYRPTAVRKVEIEKPGGGKRMLGIPIVKDRLLQQSIAQWLMQIYEPKFSKYSYGYRPGRSAHQAVLQAREFLKEGKTWVIDIDLEQFFDRINHDRLMGLLRKIFSDPNILRLIRSFLTCGIMEGGLVSTQKAGTPQGSPLSPILSNIILDELDQELAKRGHSFIRYADDISIYVKSERANKRVMENVVNFIEKRLKLKVNRDKTKVQRYSLSSLLGFGFHTPRWKVWNIRVSKKSIDRIKEKCRQITRRNNGWSEEARIQKLKLLINGWINYISIAGSVKHQLLRLDRYVQNRLRICLWKQWKLPVSRFRQLCKLGIDKRTARFHAYSHRKHARMAQAFGVLRALSNSYFITKGHIGFYETYQRITGRQTSLF